MNLWSYFNRDSDISKPYQHSIFIKLWRMLIVLIVYKLILLPFFIELFFYTSALSVYLTFLLSPLSQIFPLFPNTIPTVASGVEGAENVIKWCFCFLMSLWGTWSRTPGSNFPYFGFRVCRLYVLSALAICTSATITYPSCIIFLILN